MEFDWHNPPFNLNSSITIKDIDESFEDPFAIRLLPDSARFAAPVRFFNVGVSVNGNGIVPVYLANGKSVRVIHARPFESEERFFYQRKMNQMLANSEAGRGGD